MTAAVPSAPLGGSRKASVAVRPGRRRGRPGLGHAAAGGRDFEDEFDRLNQVEAHHRSRNDICTPMGCVREMVDAIPRSFWRRENLQVLDPCAGNGNFHAYVRRFVPLERLVFNEINGSRIANVRRMFGEGARITKRDFLAYSEDRRFDLVVSNPPYARFDEEGRRVAKNHNLSRVFIEKALRLTKDGGLMLFIVPDNWMSLSDRNVLPGELSRLQFLHLNIHGAKRWFPKVGSSFTWFLLRKSRNRRPFAVENHYLWKDRTRASLRPGVGYVPLHHNDVIDEIFAGTVDRDGKKQGIETSSDLHRYTKAGLLRERRSASHPWKVVHTPSKTVWSSRPHKHQKGWKVFISLTDRFRTFVDNCGMTQSVAYIRCGSRTEAERRKRELDAPVFRFLNDLTRYGNFNNIRILQRLPRLADVHLDEKGAALVDAHRRRCAT